MKCGFNFLFSIVIFQTIVEDEDLTHPETCREIDDMVLNSTIRTWTELDHATHKAMCNCHPGNESEEESREMRPMLGKSMMLKSYP